MDVADGDFWVDRLVRHLMILLIRLIRYVNYGRGWLGIQLSVAEEYPR